MWAAVVVHLGKLTCDKFAYDCYRRLLDMYANVVLGADHDLFEEAMDKVKADAGVEHDVDLTGGAHAFIFQMSLYPLVLNI